MERKCAASELQSVLEAIKSSDVVENRVQLVNKLQELDLSDKADLASAIEALTIFWEDFTCLDVSQCILNRATLHVAAIYLDSDISECLQWILVLGTKASIWCGKHLSMTLLSTEDSQEEEHSSIFYQLLRDFLNLSATMFSTLARHRIFSDKKMTNIVETFLMEQLKLSRECIAESKRFPTMGSEVLKAVQGIVNGAVQTCRVYSQLTNWESSDPKFGNNVDETDNEEATKAVHVVNFTKCTIEKLCEMGVIAANDGGNLVTILNVSWKGVVTLLQLCKGALAGKVNVPGIILALISLASESLRCAAETWSGLSETPISNADARKTFIPVKFYLINAARISSQYPAQSYLVYKEITLCVLMISTFRICLSREVSTKIASEVLTELLEQTSLDLLNSLLNSALLSQETKFEIFDWLFPDDFGLSYIHGSSSSTHNGISLEGIFLITCEAMSNGRILFLGRFVLLLDFLKCTQVEGDARHGMTRKLEWLLDAVVDEEIYASILILQIPTVCASGQKLELVWKSIYYYALDVLKTYMLLCHSTSEWEQLVAFLLENIFHPHFLAWQIVMELWCFMVRQGEIDFVNDIVDGLCTLYKSVACSETTYTPSSGLRKMARSICMFLANGPERAVDRVYKFVTEEDNSESSSVMFVTLLMEGFELNMLSEDLRSVARNRIVADYINYIECFDDTASASVLSGLQGSPVLMISAALQSIGANIDADKRTLKFLVSVIRYYRTTEDRKLKDLSRKLLSETLGIVSKMNFMFTSDDMEKVVLELQDLFVSSASSRDAQLYKCKPDLALFMAGTGYMAIGEVDENPKSIAVLELFHTLLRERHWAFVYLAVSAFGYFAARTTCIDLWAFVPPDAALCFDVDLGINVNQKIFMRELQAVLDKEMACFSLKHSPEQLVLLNKEGLILKKLLCKVPDIGPEAMDCEDVTVETENHSNKRRKLPDNIGKGVELLQSGLKVIVDGLSQWQQNESAEYQNFLTHFSCLEDVIGHLVGLAGSE